MAPPEGGRRGLSRRHLLAGGAAALGVLATAGAPSRADAALTVSCHGPHQAGLEPPLPAHAAFVALDLRRHVGRDDLRRLLTIWADDIARLTAGTPALADTAPELAQPGTGLTVTVGFGPGLFRAAGVTDRMPDWVAPLPAFAGDELSDRWSGGDLLLQMRSEDALDLQHAQHMLLTNAAEFARVRWVQRGFQRAAVARTPGATGRNLMGYVDGTVNPTPQTPDFDDVVRVADGPAWLVGGSGMVFRRIRMDLERWGSIDRRSRELIMGRRMDSGAPLTGTVESDVPDLDAVGESGLAVIPEFAHIRLAHQVEPHERISRQPFNYDDTTGAEPDAGLLFVAYAADPVRQFVPIQRRLAAGDALNTWVTHVGSAVFAIPPGFEPGGYPGDRLLEA
ncbi:MAG: Dyp-type peroxidase [Candidatus Nanopelagicales bacterium]